MPSEVSAPVALVAASVVSAVLAVGIAALGVMLA